MTSTVGGGGGPQKENELRVRKFYVSNKCGGQIFRKFCSHHMYGTLKLEGARDVEHIAIIWYLGWSIRKIEGEDWGEAAWVVNYGCQLGQLWVTYGQSSRHYLGWWRMDPRRLHGCNAYSLRSAFTGCEKGTFLQTSSSEFQNWNRIFKLGISQKSRPLKA